jgi:hypothetical protein
MSKTEIAEMLEVAYAQRKEANKIRAPRILIQEINRQIRKLREMQVAA